jgi:hypothetical protein
VATIETTPHELADKAALLAVYDTLTDDGWDGSVVTGSPAPNAARQTRLDLHREGQRIDAGVGDVILILGAAILVVPQAEYEAMGGTV